MLYAAGMDELMNRRAVEPRSIRKVFPVRKLDVAGVPAVIRLCLNRRRQRGAGRRDRTPGPAGREYFRGELFRSAQESDRGGSPIDPVFSLKESRRSILSRSMKRIRVPALNSIPKQSSAAYPSPIAPASPWLMRRGSVLTAEREWPSLALRIKIKLIRNGQ